MGHCGQIMLFKKRGTAGISVEVDRNYYMLQKRVEPSAQAKIQQHSQATNKLLQGVQL